MAFLNIFSKEFSKPINMVLKGYIRNNHEFKKNIFQKAICAWWPFKNTFPKRTIVDFLRKKFLTILRGKKGFFKNIFLYYLHRNNIRGFS